MFIELTIMKIHEDGKITEGEKVLINTEIIYKITPYTSRNGETLVAVYIMHNGNILVKETYEEIKNALVRRNLL